MTDPFDALREPLQPVAPRPEFVAGLRTRLAEALDRAVPVSVPVPVSVDAAAQEVPAMTTTEPAPGTTTAVPAPPTLAPYLCVADARAAIRFYEEVFGARLDGSVYVADDGRVGHAELRIGDAVVMLADPWDMPGVADPTRLGATTAQFRLVVADVDATVDRAVAAGGTVVRPAADQPYGERSGVVDDPFGHRWMLAAPLGAVPADELAARMDEQGFTLVAADEVDLGTRAPVPGTGDDEDRLAHRIAAETRVEAQRRELAGFANLAGATVEPASLWYFTFGSPDPERSVAFFEALFGWQAGRGGSGGYHFVNAHPAGGLAASDEPDVIVYFKVADFRGSLEKVRELGGEVDEPVHHASGWTAACRDPHGVRFHVSEPAPGFE